MSLLSRRPGRARRSRRTRRRLLVAGAAGVVATASAAGYAALSGGDPSDATIADRPSAASSRKTTTVAERDLVDTVEADGTLGYGTPRSVRGTGAGTVTALPEAGTVLRPDQALYSVDGHDGPILLGGELPMWRRLEDGVDDGADIRQLEANLVHLGYGAGEVTVDEDWTWATRAAVEDWQEAHGREATGQVAPTDVWFAPGPVRVGSTTVQVGDPAGGEILTLTGTDRSVHVDLDTAYGQYATEGGAVSLELTDGTTATGTITDVASTATISGGGGGGGSGQEGEPLTTTFAVEITPDEPLDALDESPVTVSFTSSKVEDALAVPLEAIVATRSDGYALEVVDGEGDDGGTHLVEVTLGRFADGWVQVEGDVHAGQEVVTA